MSNRRRIAPALLAVLLPSALPAQPAEAPPADGGGIPLAVSWTTQDRDGQRVNVIQVSGSAPLPDRAQVALEITYGGNAKVFPSLLHQAEVRAGRFDVQVADEEGQIMPGDYVVTAAVSESQIAAVGERITPTAWRLTGEARLTLGNGPHLCAFINRLSTDILRHALAIRRQYPELAQMVSRAHDKNLADSEWKQWMLKSPLGRSRDPLFKILLSPATGRFLPRSVSQAHALLRGVGELVRSVEWLLSGTQNAEILSAIRRPPAAPEGSVPAVDGLLATLFAEGRGAYAAAGERVLGDVETAYAARRGKGPGNWNSLVPQWTQSLDEIEKLFETFGDLEWMMESVVLAQKRVEMKECFALIRGHIDACGKALLAPAPAPAGPDDPQVQKLRDDIRARLTHLKRPTPA